MVVYVGLGTLGLPVFSGGGSGVAALAGPTGGFIAGFVVAAPLALQPVTSSPTSSQGVSWPETWLLWWL